ncbi:hypothetical protein [Actinomadura rifamycini]|uniref:hypothetical protein n=1 Tax=Actinomadura rifamycini TaxID=31962 RepID=UPI00047DD73B|nr:hypothetical protein [Actinomadura rifamycini]
MDAYAAEPPDLGHPENETPLNWSGLVSHIADQVGGIIALAQVVSLAMAGAILLTYFIKRRHLNSPN